MQRPPSLPESFNILLSSSQPRYLDRPSIPGLLSRSQPWPLYPISPMALLPLPPAQGDKHQFWTDPILCEETRARLKHFRSLGWLPPNFKPGTLIGIAVVERSWRKWKIKRFTWIFSTGCSRHHERKHFNHMTNTSAIFVNTTNTSLPGNSSTSRRKQNHIFQSDLPKHIPSICQYRSYARAYLVSSSSEKKFLPPALLEARGSQYTPPTF
ncbi:hypothetical protein NUU61_008587 [Penicillium alfredii]|uniref:Uncharacterized protein n=1 Tax=Penicillium alfredii TaxID=1506179 RepID=A0A9W9ELG0_9EURO|nr:uncharacterized protein NUU61_008587 [Penicillium alfredii]KAJ5084008.1 hypothetical protein NUU61_008587 [Penicillium alfredii]